MQIISIGKGYEKPKAVSCSNCKSVLGYTGADIHAKDLGEAAGIYRSQHYIKCAVCGHEITVPTP